MAILNMKKKTIADLKKELEKEREKTKNHLEMVKTKRQIQELKSQRSVYAGVKKIMETKSSKKTVSAVYDFFHSAGQVSLTEPKKKDKNGKRDDFSFF